MDINLTWDLFIIAFFIIIVAYSFIVGKNHSLKIIIGSYLAILSADAVGNLFVKYVATAPIFLKILKLFSIGSMDKAEMTVKILVFVGILVLIVVRGGFSVHAGQDFEGIIGLILLLVFGFLSASLILSAIIVYAAGGSFVNLVGAGMDPATMDFYQSSRLARILLNNYDLWFVLPAMVFLLTSFFSPVSDDASKD